MEYICQENQQDSKHMTATRGRRRIHSRSPR